MRALSAASSVRSWYRLGLGVEVDLVDFLSNACVERGLIGQELVEVSGGVVHYACCHFRGDWRACFLGVMCEEGEEECAVLVWVVSGECFRERVSVEYVNVGDSGRKVDGVGSVGGLWWWLWGWRWLLLCWHVLFVMGGVHGDVFVVDGSIPQLEFAMMVAFVVGGSVCCEDRVTVGC